MHLESLLAQSLLATAREENAAAELRCRVLLERAATGRELQSALQRELARAGLTETGFAVLAVLLAREPQPVLRSEIGLAAELSPVRTDDALTRLEMSGLVQRHRDEQDRRLIWLRLTVEGRAQISAALRRYVAAAGRVTATLNAAELAASIAISGKLRRGAAQLADATAHFTAA